METNTIVSFAQLGMQNGIGILLFSGLGIALLIWLRTRSTHILLSRLWRIFNGKVECSEALVNDFLSCQSAVLQFRFMTGLRARTIQQIESLCNWMRHNNEDVGDVVACGRYFDLEKPGLKPLDDLPGAWKLSAMVAIVILLAAFFIGGLLGVASDRALLRFKVSETWFFLDKISAIPVSQGVGFKLDQCPMLDTIMKANPGFTRSDVGLICETAAAGQIGPYVDSTVADQKFLSGLLCLYSFCFLLSIVAGVRNVVSARDMSRRLKVRSETASTGETSTGALTKDEPSQSG